jgi:hypothetical protein
MEWNMMTTNDLDPGLKALFAQAEQDLDGEALTARVVAKTRNVKLLALASVASLALLTVLGVWFYLSIPLLDFAVLVSNLLSVSLVDLGQGWLGLIFLPINNLASLLLLTVKGFLMLYKWIIGAGLRD